MSKNVPPRPVVIGWKSEQRSAIQPLRLFEPVATLILEKQGFTTNVGGQNLVFGAFPGRTTAAMLAPADNGISVVFTVLTATEDEESSNDLASDLLSRMVKVFYE